MASEDLSLSGVRTLDQALGRTRNGTDAVKLADRLGLWTSQVHSRANSRPEFPSRISELTPPQLSDLFSTWTAEYGRILELCGVLAGQESLLKLQLKSAQASARARIRRNATEGEKTKLTSTALSDAADEDPAVVDIAEQQALLIVLTAHAGAAREATQQFLTTISREIAFRDAQLKARVY